MRTPDQWADEHRILPKGSAEPGPWRSSRNPFVIGFVRACADPSKKMVVGVFPSQSGKTDGVLNVVGHRLSDDPVPILYIGPTRSNVEKVIEPRFTKMVASADTLKGRLLEGKKSSKTYKNIAGVSFRLAWAGSATELAAEPACIVIVDERDRMDDDIAGEGDPIELANARHTTYPDGKTIAISSPTIGTVEVELDEESGLYFWKIEEENVESPIWKLFQQGTMYHWAWPCPDCNSYFIPRFSLLRWKEKSTPQQAHDTAMLACPCCGVLIPDYKKVEMNARGVFVAPGQKIVNGEVVGRPRNDSSTDTYWVSGVCSPWSTFGRLAYKYIDAVRSGEPERIQAVLNTAFAELWAVAGEAPKVDAVLALRQTYGMGEVPAFVQYITCGVDVQKDRLYYVIRGWGPQSSSALIEHGELYAESGDVDEQEIWDLLSEFRERRYGNNLPIARIMIDSGYKAHKVYEFAKRHFGWAIPSKGKTTADKPLTISKVDVTWKGQVIQKGMQLWHINTDYFKSWVHSRIEWPIDKPGAWVLPMDATEDYCKQIVAEARVPAKSGNKHIWVKVKRANHYFDAEVAAAAAAYSIKGNLSASAPAKPSGQAKPRPRGTVSAGVEV